MVADSRFSLVAFLPLINIGLSFGIFQVSEIGYVQFDKSFEYLEKACTKEPEVLKETWYAVFKERDSFF